MGVICMFASAAPGLAIGSEGAMGVVILSSRNLMLGEPGDRLLVLLCNVARWSMADAFAHTVLARGLMAGVS